jgi:hypothetical protein
MYQHNLVASQHGSNTTWKQHNMVATQHGRTQHGTNIIGQRQHHKGQEGSDNNTSREAATTVSKSVHDGVFE